MCCSEKSYFLERVRFRLADRVIRSELFHSCDQRTVLAWLAKNPGGFGQHNPAMCAFLSDSGGAYCTSIVCRSAPCIPFWLRTTFTFWDTGWPTPATQHPYGVDTKLKLKRRTRVRAHASVRAASCCQRAQQLATNCALEPARGSLDARQGRR